MVAVDEVGPDVSAVVVSHDRFADVWPGFFALLFRFWPDRPYPLYLISNYITFPDERVFPLQVGADLSWSQTLMRGLERITSRHVLIILEDFYLTAPVDTASIRRLHNVMVDTGAAYLRLMANPKPDRPHPKFRNVGFIDKGAPYRTSLQIAFWDRQTLLDLLRAGETPWDFEIKGSRRSDDLSDPFLSIYDGMPSISYLQTVLRGKWLPHAIRHFTPLGIAFDTASRPVESELYLWWQATLVRRLLGRIWRMACRRPL